VSPALAAAAALALKSAAVFAAAWLAALAMRKGSAAARRMAWALAFAAVLALPLLTVLLPGWGVPVLPASPAPAAAEVAAAYPPAGVATLDRPGFGVTPSPEIPPPPLEAVAPAAHREMRIDLPTLVLAVWLAGVVVALLRLAAGIASARRLVRGAAEVRGEEWSALLAEAAEETGVRRPVRLVASGEVAVPLTWGWRAPVVVLPGDADAWPRERKRCVLLHELAHARRGDALLQAAAWVACALHWFDPLAWHALRRLRAEIEFAADDRVLESGLESDRYAAHLLEAARSFGRTRAALPALAMAQPSRFEGRLLAILNPARRRRAPAPGTALAAGAAALALTLPLAGLRPVPAASPHTDAVSPTRTPRPSAPPARADTTRRVVSEGRVDARTTGGVTMRGVVPARGFRCEAVAGPPGSGFREMRGTYQVEDAPKRRYVLVYTAAERCVEGDFPEPVAFSEDDGAVLLPAGQEAVLREKRGGTDRVLRLRGGERQYTVNGRPAALDEAWAAALARELAMESAAGGEARVRRLLAQGGVDGVLAEIARVPNPATRADYLAALVDARPRDADVALRVVRAARAQPGEKHELAQVLRHVAARWAGDDAVRRAVWEAGGGIDPYARGELLGAFAASGDREARRFALAAAAELPRESDRAPFLRQHGARYAGDAALRADFFRLIEGLSSYGWRKEVLLAVVQGPATPDAVLLEVIRAAAGSRYGDETADVLAFLGTWRLVRTPELQAAYRQAAGSIRDPEQRERALSALGEGASP
jgi:beta-lactamase regulating signal transducer with metallopeptidase domain